MGKHGRPSMDSARQVICLLISCPYVGERRLKIKFGVPLDRSFPGGEIPESILGLFRRLCHEGVATVNVFRKPGNHSDVEKMKRKLQDGKPVDLERFAIHTIASVVKSFVGRIPDGVFGVDGERSLLAAMESKDLSHQYDTISQVMHSLSTASQRLAVLLFGTLSRTLNHAHENGMTAESLAVSIAPSVIVTCSKQPMQIKNAVTLLKLLIQLFPLQRIFGTPNVSYFSAVMGTTIRVTEWFKYDFNGPQSSVKLRSSRKQRVIQSILEADSKENGFDVARHSVSGRVFPSTSSTATDETKAKNVNSDNDDDDDDADVRPKPSLLGPATVVDELDQVLTIPLEELLEMNRHHERTRHATRFSEVRERQLRRLRTRTEWVMGTEGAREGKRKSFVFGSSLTRRPSSSRNRGRVDSNDFDHVTCSTKDSNNDSAISTSDSSRTSFGDSTKMSSDSNERPGAAADASTIASSESHYFRCVTEFVPTRVED